MARALFCDVCKRQTEAIVAKMFFGPMSKGSAQAYHSSYSHHLDVGVCCSEKVLKIFNWNRRISSKEYNSRRKAGKT